MASPVGSGDFGDPAGEGIEAVELSRLSVITLDLSLDKMSSALGD
jgi:hypothetical protein